MTRKVNSSFHKSVKYVRWKNTSMALACLPIVLKYLNISRIYISSNSIMLWMTNWAFKVNRDKTEANLFFKERCQPRVHITLENTRIVELKDEGKYLGLKLDRRVTWNQNIICTRVKAQDQCGQWLNIPTSRMKQKTVNSIKSICLQNSN